MLFFEDPEPWTMRRWWFQAVCYDKHILFKVVQPETRLTSARMGDQEWPTKINGLVIFVTNGLTPGTTGEYFFVFNVGSLFSKVSAE